MPEDSEPEDSDPEDSVIDWPQGSPVAEDRQVVVSIRAYLLPLEILIFSQYRPTGFESDSSEDSFTLEEHRTVREV